jgi:hypothetical protein
MLTPPVYAAFIVIITWIAIMTRIIPICIIMTITPGVGEAASISAQDIMIHILE